MRRKSTWLLAVLTLAGLIMLPNQVSAQDGSGNPCQLGDEYLASGLLGYAELEYQEVLSTSPTEKCAVDGLAAIGGQKCEVAKKQKEAGDDDAARQTYLAIVAIQPGLDCAVQGLAGLGTVSCGDADSYLAAGAASLAEETYNKILDANPGQACALEGLTRVAQKKCEQAGVQASSGDVDGAKTSYTSILNAYPNLECAVEGIAKLTDPVVSIKSLVALGNYDQAWTDLIAALQKDPENKELIAISNQPWTWVFKFTKYWDVYAGVIFSLFGAFVIFALFLYLWVRSNRLRLDVGDFKMDLIPPASIAGDDGLINLQERMINRFEEAFNKLGQSRRVRRPDLIAQPMETLAVPNLSSLPTVSITTQIIQDTLKIISSMLPPKLVAVSCRLDEDGYKGLGIGVKLTYNRNNEVWGMDYIWEKDLEPGSLQFNPDTTDPKDHDLVSKALVLVKYAAVLCVWRYIEGKYGAKAKTHLLNSFGTVDYRSHILTYLATEMQIKKPEDLLPVEKLLRRALTIDPDNVAALNNIGFLMYQKGNNESKAGNTVEGKALHAEGEKYLRRVMEISEQSDQFSTAFITAKYVLGIMSLDDGNLGDAASLLEDAENHARASGDTAADLLDMIRIPLASTLRPQDPARANGIIATIAAKAQTNPRVVYNLACYYAAASEDDPEKYFDMSLRHLERTFITDQSYVKYSESDPSLQKLRDARGDAYKNLLAKYPETKKDEAKPAEGGGS